MHILGVKITDEQIIQTILSTSSQTEAAKVLNITRATLNRRLQKPELKTKIAKYRRDILDKTSTKLLQANVLATDKLTSLLNSDSELTVYNACSKILQLSRDYVVAADISARLDKLEQENNKI